MTMFSRKKPMLLDLWITPEEYGGKWEDVKRAAREMRDVIDRVYQDKRSESPSLWILTKSITITEMEDLKRRLGKFSIDFSFSSEREAISLLREVGLPFEQSLLSGHLKEGGRTVEG